MRQVVVETPTKPENRRLEVNRRFRRFRGEGHRVLAIYIFVPFASSSLRSDRPVPSRSVSLGVARNGARETREKTRKGMRGVGWEAHVTSRDPTLDAVGTRSCAIRRGMSKKRATREKPRIEDDYDLATKGEERGAIKQTKLYSPHCGSPTDFYRFAVQRSAFIAHLSPLTSHLSPPLDTPFRRHVSPVADTPTRRFADSSLPVADPPTRRFADSSLPVADPPTRRFADSSLPVADPPTRRFADSSLPVADPPTRRFADPSLPVADPPTRRFADSSLPVADRRHAVSPTRLSPSPTRRHAVSPIRLSPSPTRRHAVSPIRLSRLACRTSGSISMPKISARFSPVNVAEPSRDDETPIVTLSVASVTSSR